MGNPEKNRPTTVTIGSGPDKGNFTRKIFKKKDSDVETSVLLSDDIDTVNQAIADMNVGLLRTIQDKLQSVNSADDTFRVSNVLCDITIDIEAIKSKEYGLIIRYTVDSDKTRIQTNLKAELHARQQG